MRPNPNRHDALPRLGAALLALRSEPGRLLFLCPHVRADGDAWGASIALATALERLGLNVRVVASEPMSAQFDYLGPVPQLVLPETPEGAAALAHAHPDRTVLMLDCSAPDRLAERQALLEGLDPDRLWVLDHHISDMPEHPLRLIDRTAAATAELASGLITELESQSGLTLIDTGVATALYTGLLTDTGRFTYPATTEATMRAAGRLLTYGVDAQFLSGRLFDTLSLGALSLRAEVVPTLRFTEDGSGAVAVITPEMMTRSGAVTDDLEALPSWIRSIEGVKMAALLRRTERGTVRGNLRSVPPYQVQPIAKRYGGGGHAQASGFTVEERTPEDVADELLAIFAETVRRTDGGAP